MLRGRVFFWVPSSGDVLSAPNITVGELKPAEAGPAGSVAFGNVSFIAMQRGALKHAHCDQCTKHMRIQRGGNCCRSTFRGGGAGGGGGYCVHGVIR